MATKIEVVQNPTKPVEKPVLAQAIVVLLSHDTGIGQGVIKAVLESMADLQKTYLS